VWDGNVCGRIIGYSEWVPSKSDVTTMYAIVILLCQNFKTFWIDIMIYHHCIKFQFILIFLQKSLWIVPHFLQKVAASKSNIHEQWWNWLWSFLFLSCRLVLKIRPHIEGYNASSLLLYIWFLTVISIHLKDQIFIASYVSPSK
jgi:hypothetical protein